MATRKTIWMIVPALVLMGCASATEVVPTQVIGPPTEYAEISLLPYLTPPDGAQMAGGGGGGGYGAEGLELDFTSDLELSEVHAHFAEQLEAQGWQHVDEQQADGAMTTFWELVDDEGTSWAARLTLSERAEGGEGAYHMAIKLLLPR